MSNVAGGILPRLYPDPSVGRSKAQQNEMKAQEGERLKNIKYALLLRRVLQGLTEICQRLAPDSPLRIRVAEIADECLKRWSSMSIRDAYETIVPYTVEELARIEDPSLVEEWVDRWFCQDLTGYSLPALELLLEAVEHEDACKAAEASKKPKAQGSSSASTSTSSAPAGSIPEEASAPTHLGPGDRFARMGLALKRSQDLVWAKLLSLSNAKRAVGYFDSCHEASPPSAFYTIGKTMVVRSAATVKRRYDGAVAQTAAIVADAALATGRAALRLGQQAMVRVGSLFGLRSPSSGSPSQDSSYEDGAAASSGAQLDPSSRQPPEPTVVSDASALEQQPIEEDRSRLEVDVSEQSAESPSDGRNTDSSGYEYGSDVEVGSSRTGSDRGSPCSDLSTGSTSPTSPDEIPSNVSPPPESPVSADPGGDAPAVQVPVAGPSQDPARSGSNENVPPESISMVVIPELNHLVKTKKVLYFCYLNSNEASGEQVEPNGFKALKGFADTHRENFRFVHFDLNQHTSRLQRGLIKENEDPEKGHWAGVRESFKAELMESLKYAQSTISEDRLEAILTAADGMKSLLPEWQLLQGDMDAKAKKEVAKRLAKAYLMFVCTVLRIDLHKEIDPDILIGACKDGIDRAGVMNLLDAYIRSLIAYGRVDPELERRIFLQTQSACWMAKKQPMVTPWAAPLQSLLNATEAPEMQALLGRLFVDRSEVTAPRFVRTGSRYDNASPAAHYDLSPKEDTLGNYQGILMNKWAHGERESRLEDPSPEAVSSHLQNLLKEELVPLVLGQQGRVRLEPVQLTIGGENEYRWETRLVLKAKESDREEVFCLKGQCRCEEQPDASTILRIRMEVPKCLTPPDMSDWVDLSE